LGWREVNRAECGSVACVGKRKHGVWVHVVTVYSHAAVSPVRSRSQLRRGGGGVWATSGVAPWWGPAAPPAGGGGRWRPAWWSRVVPARRRSPPPAARARAATRRGGSSAADLGDGDAAAELRQPLLRRPALAVRLRGAGGGVQQIGALVHVNLEARAADQLDPRGHATPDRKRHGRARRAGHVDAAPLAKRVHVDGRVADGRQLRSRSWRW